MKINGVDAIYYFAHDLDRAQSFYTMMFGAQPSTAVAGSFCEWTLPNGESFGLVKGTQYRPGNGVLFNVDDVRGSVHELSAGGVAFG